MKALEFTFWFLKKEECESWYTWFKERGVPAAIIKKDEKFCVFRQGTIIRKTEKSKGTGVRKVDFPKLESPFEMIELCNGFEY